MSVYEIISELYTRMVGFHVSRVKGNERQTKVVPRSMSPFARIMRVRGVFYRISL